MKLRIRRASTIVALIGILGLALSAPLPVLGSAVCPPAPTTLADLIASDTGKGPLAEQFRPVYGVYAEAAAGCWPGEVITVTGFVARPEGIGGVVLFSIEPAWIVSRAHFLSTGDAIDPDAGPVGPFFPVAVPPALEAQFGGLDRKWVRVSGHFDDAAAATCIVSSSDPGAGAVPTAEQAIEICRTSFVVTGVELFAPVAAPTLPPTATNDPPAHSVRALPGWIPLVVLAAAASLALHHRRSARGEPSRK
jgi:hypothetical protein